MRTYGKTFIGGFAIIAMTSAQVRLVMRNDHIGAFFGAFLIAIMWRLNVMLAKRDSWLGTLLYGLGCATGALFGMWVVS